MRLQHGFGGFTAVALSLAITACGGGGGGSDAPPPPPPNQIPVSAAGADQSVFKAAAVTLDGTASTDADSNPLSYRWSQTAGTAVILSSTTATRPTFTAPSLSGTLTFSLVVNDGRVDSSADTVQVTIANRTPVANAGVDGTATGGALYTLDALGSTDPDQDALSYTWVQLAGPAVTLTNVGLGRARFTAPYANGRLDFAVTANDGETNSAQDTVSVIVSSAVGNGPPSVYLDPGYTVPKRSTVNLYGYGYDPDGMPMTYQWTQVAGPTVTLTGATTPFLSFAAPASPATLEFELVVNDGTYSSTPGSISITVANFAPQVLAVQLTPDAPRTLDDLVVSAATEDPDGDPITVTYTWQRNGVVQPSVTGSTYPASLTTRDDVIVATVTANDGTVSTAVDASVSIEDTPPTLTATAAPTDVNYGDMVSFQVSAGTDPDGDPIGNYVVKLGPVNFAVSNTGLVSWQARGPMFESVEEIAWTIGLSSAPTAAAGGTIRMHHTARQVPLLRTGGTVPQHREELVLSDLDADGIDEILLTDGRTLSTMTKVGAAYDQDWAYPFNLGGQQYGVFAIAAANVTGDANEEIFIANEGGVTQLAGDTRRPANRFTDPQLFQCHALRVADLEGDGPKEVVCLGSETAYGSGTGSVIVILNGADLTLKARINQTGLGAGLEVGNVDADPAIEIVTSNGYVYDGATRNNEWAYGPQFGSTIAIGDLDGDAIGEIVALVGWSTVRVYSAVSRSPLRELPPGYLGGIAELRVQDIGGDARAEVITGDAQWGGITAYRYNTGTLAFDTLFTIGSQDHGTSALAIGNTDNDAPLEFVWGTGVSHSGQDILVVSEYLAPAITVEWTSALVGEFDGPFIGGQVARTAPGTRLLMFASPRTQSGYGGAKLMAMDPLTGATIASGDLGSNWAYAQGIDVADIDNDSIDEIFLSSANTYDPFFTIYDFATAASEWTSPAGYASAASVTHADFSGDGHTDFLTFGTDGRATIFNVYQSNIIWQSTQLSGSGVAAAAADLDHDGLLEVIALTSNYLYVYGRTSTSNPFLERANIPVINATGLLVADTDGDGQHEIFVLSSDSYSYANESTLRVYNGSLAPLRTATIAARVNNMVVEPSTTPRKNLLISTVGNDSYSYYATGASEIWAIDAVTGAGVWRSPGFPGTFSRQSLNAVDGNLDGQYELSFGTNVGAFITR